MCMGTWAHMAKLQTPTCDWFIPGWRVRKVRHLHIWWIELPLYNCYQHHFKLLCFWIPALLTKPFTGYTGWDKYTSAAKMNANQGQWYSVHTTFLCNFCCFFVFLQDSTLQQQNKTFSFSRYSCMVSRSAIITETFYSFWYSWLVVLSASSRATADGRAIGLANCFKYNRSYPKMFLQKHRKLEGVAESPLKQPDWLASKNMMSM